MHSSTQRTHILLLELLQCRVDTVSFGDFREQRRPFRVEPLDLKLQSGQLLLQVGVLGIPVKEKW
jgi:hypothetical protein